MKIFNQLPQYIYMSDTDGTVYRARVTEINHDYGLAYGPGYCPEITIKCTDLIFTRKNPEIKAVDADAFQAMLENGYGTGNPEV